LTDTTSFIDILLTNDASIDVAKHISHPPTKNIVIGMVSGSSHIVKIENVYPTSILQLPETIVGVGVGVAFGVPVCVLVGVLVGVPVGVLVGVPVGVDVIEVEVGVNPGHTVPVGVIVGVCDAVILGVGVLDGVLLGVGGNGISTINIFF
jgi:hypothetical protein